MLELANLGAAVLHPRAVEYTKHNQVKLVVRSSFNHNEGTVVKEEASMEQGVVVSGIAFDKNVARISILGVSDTPGVLAQVFGELAKEAIDVDIIVQSGVRTAKQTFPLPFPWPIGSVRCRLSNKSAARFRIVTLPRKIIW